MTLYVNAETDSVSIRSKTHEYIYWDKQEWIDDPLLVLTIANAITIAMKDPKTFIRLYVKGIKR